MLAMMSIQDKRNAFPAFHTMSEAAVHLMAIIKEKLNQLIIQLRESRPPYRWPIVNLAAESLGE